MTRRAGPLALCVALALPAAAQTVLIDFDDRPATSCAFSSAERVGSQWSALGVTFTAMNPGRTGAIVEQSCTGFDRVSGHSPPNLVGYVAGITEIPIVIELDPPVVSASLKATNWNTVDELTLTAYDSLDVAVDADTISTLGMVGPLQLMTVSGVDIVRLELVTSSGDIALDDLELEPEMTVEPIVYESPDPETIVDVMYEVGPAGTSPFPHAPASGPELYYQVDDGSGMPAVIYLVEDGPTGILIHF